MSVFLDLVIILVFLFCVLYYRKKGFISSLIGMVRFLLSLALALAFSGWLADKIQPSIEQNIGNGSGSVISQIGEYAVSVGFISRILAFALIFFLTALVLKLVEIILNCVFSLPVLKTMNKLLGALLGVVIGFFWIEILSVIFMIVAEYFVGTVDWLKPTAFDNTMIVSRLYENNIFKKIFELIIN